jgi:hypothetical protein
MNLKTKTIILVLAGVAVAVIASSIFVYGIVAQNQNPYGYGQSPYGSSGCSMGPMMGGMGPMMGGQYTSAYNNQPYRNQGTAPYNYPGFGGGGMMGGYGSYDMRQFCNQMMGGNYYEDVATQGQNQVLIMQYSFMPITLVVNKGTTVTWTNLDPVIHTVESGTHDEPFDLFDSGSLNQE